MKKKIVGLMLLTFLLCSPVLAAEIRIVGEISGAIYVDGVLIKILSGAPQPQPTPTPTPTPVPVPTPVPIPPGGIGSHQNPYLLTTYIGALFSYGFDATYGPQVTIPAGGTVWFMLDPLLLPQFAQSGPAKIKVTVNNYDQTAYDIRAVSYYVDRDDHKETLFDDQRAGATGYTIMPYDRGNYVFLSLSNTGASGRSVSIRWK